MNIYTEPVIGDSFFAREDILNSLLKSAADIKLGYRQNIAIVGNGLIGKTSLLLHFLGIVKDDQRLIPIYVNLKGISFADFADNFIRVSLYQCLKKRRKTVKTDNLDYLINSCRSLFPKTCELIVRIKALAEEKEYDESYSALLDLNVVLSSESGAFPIIVLDEFNLISSFALNKPFQVLGQKIMVQQKSLFVLSSSHSITAKKILAEKLSLLFGGFKTLDIGPFTPEQARVFIDTRCKGIDIAEEIRDFILTFTGGHPFYLGSIIQRLQFIKACGTDNISSKHLSQVIAELLFSPAGVVNRFFANQLRQACSDLSNRDIYDILNMILLNARASDIASKSTISSAQLMNLMNKLLELGMVSKSGCLYAVTDAVFRMWIEVKSKPVNLCFDFMTVEETSNYAKEVEARLAAYRASRRKSLDDRIMELISSFNNDRFFIDERERMLPQLKYVSQRELGQGSSMIIAQARKRWIFLLSCKRISEDDIYAMLDKIRSMRYDSSRIIVVAASDIDDAAKIIAKQKRFWIWGRDDLNKLFQFYKGHNALIA